MDSIGWAVALLPPIHAATVATPLVLTDLRQRRLPNRLVLPVLASAVICTTIASALTTEWMRLGWSFFSSVTIFLIGLTLVRWSQVGMGDVKLAMALGHALGWFNPGLPWMAIWLAYMLASVQSIWRRYRKSRSRVALAAVEESIAFGPYLFAGFILSLYLVSAQQFPELQLLGWTRHW